MPFDGVVYYYIRGMTNYPLIVGDLQLPAEARLRLYSNINTTIQPHSFLPLVRYGRVCHRRVWWYLPVRV